MSVLCGIKKKLVQAYMILHELSGESMKTLKNEFAGI